MTQARPDRANDLRAAVLRWRNEMVAAFLDSYSAAIAGCPLWPADPRQARQLVDCFVLEKALSEIGYELANRPAWLILPLQGIRELLLEGETS